jgi:hypothetical protein
MEQAPQPPPPWGDDPLSKFMASADRNVRVCALNWPDVYEIQERAHGLLKQIGEVVESDHGDAHLGVPRMLVLRSHSAVLAAMRLAMSGQAFEARPLLRLAIEETWYALHVAKDPAPPTRAEVWWNRGDNPQATQACQAEFKVGTVRGTHEALDAPTAAAMKHLYDDTITFGGHPNQGGVAASLRIDRSQPDEVTVNVGVLQPGTLAAAAALKASVDVTVGIAKTVGLIYPERFRIMSVDEEIDQLARSAGGDVFRRYGPASASGVSI